MARRLEAELVWPPYTCSVGPRLNKVYTASASEAILSNALDREDKKEGLQLGNSLMNIWSKYNQDKYLVQVEMSH